MNHIAIIGAGITGVTTAYSLAERGYRVTVLDRHRYPAMETSFANGGQLSASNAEVWNSWTTVAKGIKWMFTKDAPLLMSPMPSWHKYSWMAEFVGAIGNYRKNTITTTKMALAARARLFELAKREQIAFDHETRGILHIYEDAKSFRQAEAVNRLLQEGGLDRHAVTASDISRIEPSLAGNYYGGFFTPSDSTGDIHKFTRGLAAACQRMGVNFLQDCAVEAIQHRAPSVELSFRRLQDGPSNDVETLAVDGVVICAGIASRHFAAMVGDRVNIYPVKGYSITVQLDDAASQNGAPWVSLLDDKAKIVTSRLGRDRFRVAGTAELRGENRDIRADRITPLVEWSRRHFPAVETSKIAPWSGLRPMLPDMLPRVGAGRMPGIFYNTGHGHLGWTLAAGTAEAVAETIAHHLPVVKLAKAA